MKRYPKSPQIEFALWGNPDRSRVVFEGMSLVSDAEYLHWEELRHKQPPHPFNNSLDWWYALKLKRGGSVSNYPELMGYQAHALKISRQAKIEALLVKIDRQLAGEIAHQGAPLDSQTKNRYVSSSLMEEAIHSSLFEGAVSTRELAKDMLREKRKPHNKHETMILNNHRAMLRLNEMARHPLTMDAVLELHSILVDQTLEKPEQAGRLQPVGEERIVVWDHQSNSAVHTPPPAEELQERMRRLIEFANGNDLEGDRYTHPVIRSVLIHFQLAFDHPFADGNGRTARALFYWSMLRRGYWLAEFISISRLIHQRPGPYRRSFLFVESDDQDATYFVKHQIQIIDQAIDELHAYIELKRSQIDEIRNLIEKRSDLNMRQLALLQHASRHLFAYYTHESHAESHRVGIMTARSDLLELVKLGYLTRSKNGNKFIYRPSPNLASKLK